MTQLNVVSAPKTATFQMRINPEVKAEAEKVFSQCGLTFTDAVNVFIQQTLNVGGMTYTAANNAIDYHGGGTVYNTLASFIVPHVYGTVPVTATWRFNGVYSGNSIGEIVASGVVNA